MRGKSNGIHNQLEKVGQQVHRPFRAHADLLQQTDFEVSCEVTQRHENTRDTPRHTDEVSFASWGRSEKEKNWS